MELKRKKTQAHHTLTFKSPRRFIGAIVERAELKYECIGYEPYIRKTDGEESYVLLWCRDNDGEIIKTGWRGVTKYDFPAEIK